MSMNHSYRWASDYNKIVNLYHGESDRAAAVLASSFMDKCLEDCLKAFLVDDPSVEDLFTGYGPLSSFSAKIGMAFALGLINQDMKADLNYIRKVRNHFAHHPAETSFDVSPVRELCSNLSMARPIRREDGGFFQESNPRAQFLLTLGTIVCFLYDIMPMQQKRVSPVVGVVGAPE